MPDKVYKLGKLAYKPHYRYPRIENSSDCRTLFELAISPCTEAALTSLPVTSTFPQERLASYTQFSGHTPGKVFPLLQGLLDCGLPCEPFMNYSRSEIRLGILCGQVCGKVFKRSKNLMQSGPHSNEDESWALDYLVPFKALIYRRIYRKLVSNGFKVCN